MTRTPNSVLAAELSERVSRAAEETIGLQHPCLDGTPPDEEVDQAHEEDQPLPVHPVHRTSMRAVVGKVTNVLACLLVKSAVARGMNMVL